MFDKFTIKNGNNKFFCRANVLINLKRTHLFRCTVHEEHEGDNDGQTQYGGPHVAWSDSGMILPRTWPPILLYAVCNLVQMLWMEGNHAKRQTNSGAYAFSPRNRKKNTRGNRPVPSQSS